MLATFQDTTEPVHPWLRTIHAAFVPRPTTPLLEEVLSQLRQHFRLAGHHVQPQPDGESDVLISTAKFGQPIGWRDSVLLTGRRRYGLRHAPTTYTLIHAAPDQLQHVLDHFKKALAKDPPEPSDFDFPGLAQSAYHTLIEQGRRGGPIMALIRLLQAQAISIRIILLVGEAEPQAAYYFDLAGAYPRIEANDPNVFYTDMVRRIVTSVSTNAVTHHQVMEGPIPRALWDSLSTPEAMCAAARQLGQRNFFTEMIRVADVVHAPAVADAVASQYSEGCFATWDPTLGALVATITGSARPVEKENITPDELSVIVGVRPDGLGAIVRHVEARRNDPPSSESVEMMDMDSALPRITVDGARVPVLRSKLHGHRGISAYDPRRVEFVPLDTPYYHYPVSCATDAQARAIKAAFARSQALRNPDDPRQAIFTILPGHGVVMAEKWAAGEAPFQVLWELMDAGQLVVDRLVPQRWHTYVPATNGLHRLSE
jgi:hypothetical protein